MPPKPNRTPIARIPGWYTGADEYIRSLSHPASSSASDSEAENTRARRLREYGSGDGAWNTAVPLTETSGQTFGFDPKDADSRNARLGEEIRWTTVGPMPVEDFLEEFFEASALDFTEMPPSKGAFDGVVTEKTKNERDMYAPLIKALNAVESKRNKRGPRCPGFTFRDTSAHPDTSGGILGAKKPDICCYANRHLPMVDARKGDLQSRTDMGLTAAFFEIKLNESDDFFLDPPSDVADVEQASRSFVLGRFSPSNLPKAVVDLGQNTSYAVEIGMRQFRHCVYSVILSGVLARLARWDRAGLIVTKAFSLRSHPDLLCRFFWCFAKVSDTERGYDLSVEPAALHEEELFKKLIRVHITQQLPLASAEEQQQLLDRHYAPNCVTSVHIPREKDDQEISYQLLISRPLSVPLSMVGRSTRAYWAVDVDSLKVVFLKDTWRHHGDNSTREGDIIKYLLNQGVSYVPPVEFQSDVPMVKLEKDDKGAVVRTLHERPQMTWTQKYLAKPWVCGNLEHLKERVVLRTHYFLVLQYAGCPLTDCRGASELFHGARDALQALRTAYIDGEQLHRDVTPGNIILYRESDSLIATAPRTGFLVDWELSCDASDPTPIKRTRYEASMTWQFLSVSLSSPEGARIHRIQDDMESLYYVVLYCSLLYLPHALAPQRLSSLMHDMFDWRSEFGDNRRVAGGGKSADLFVGIWTRGIPWGSPAIGTWIQAIHERIKDYYDTRKESPDYVGKQWTPEAFAAFFDAFLEVPPGSELPTNDRKDYIQAHRAHFSHIAPRVAQERPNQATVSTATVTPQLYRDPPNPAGQTTSVLSNKASRFRVSSTSSGLPARGQTGAPSTVTQLPLAPLSLGSSESRMVLRSMRRAPPQTEDDDAVDLGKRKSKGVDATTSKRSRHEDAPPGSEVPSAGAHSENMEDSQSAGGKTRATEPPQGRGRGSMKRGGKRSGRASTEESQRKIRPRDLG
ncbi:hypothetical protein OH77DRAFT_1593615 [Trametes cingulata]|nr:hypothetical protein OH77DRAFT_1593615 [Trametes cingulata]